MTLPKSSQVVSNQEQDLYSDQQPSSSMDMSQMVVDSIPQIQAQIGQISVMLQNPSLPNQVRHATEMQQHQLQIQLQQAQTIAAALAAASSLQQQQQQQLQQVQSVGIYNPQGYQKPDQRPWTNPFSNQQPAGQDSAYQRLPLHRRRNLKRERPSDFLDVSGEQDKMPRYWE
jgi:protein MPE1